MTESETAWAAGLYEGEGNVCARRRRSSSGSILYQPYMKLNMCTEEPVRRLHCLLGIGHVQVRDSDNPNHQRQWSWQIGGWKGALMVYKILAPWLSKRRIDQFRLVFDKCASSVDSFGSNNGAPGARAWISFASVTPCSPEWRPEEAA